LPVRSSSHRADRRAQQRLRW